MTFLLYDTKAHTAAMNMAIDEVLLKKNEPILRFYTWKENAITIGRFQSHREVVLHATEKDGIPVIRRETGGKAVFHGDDLTISVILDSKNEPGSVRKTLLPIGSGIVHGLHLLGLHAHQVSGNKKYHVSSYCFSTHSPYEVVVGMKKIAGIAGRLYKNKVLFQISIPLIVNIQAIHRYLMLEHDEDHNELQAIGLKEVLDSRFHIDSIKEALIAGFLRSLNAQTRAALLTDYEIDEAHHLVKIKYNQGIWNFVR